MEIDAYSDIRKIVAELMCVSGPLVCGSESMSLVFVCLVPALLCAMRMPFRGGLPLISEVYI